MRGSEGGGEVSPAPARRVLSGEFPVALRPPHPWPKAGRSGVASSLFYFERDLHGLNHPFQKAKLLPFFFIVFQSFWCTREVLGEKNNQSEFGIRRETGELYMLNKKERTLTIEILKMTLATETGREFLIERFGQERLKTAAALLEEMGVPTSKQ